jgi:hypothetical protein
LILRKRAGRGRHAPMGCKALICFGGAFLAYCDKALIEILRR